MAGAAESQDSKRRWQVVAAASARPLRAAGARRPTEDGVCRSPRGMAVRAPARLGRGPLGAREARARGVLERRGDYGNVAASPTGIAPRPRRPVDRADVPGVA